LTFLQTVILSEAVCSFIAGGVVEGPATRIAPPKHFSLSGTDYSQCSTSAQGYHPSVNLAEPQHFAPLEIALLLLFAATSATLFLLRFAPILRTILTARKDLGFSLAPIAKRIQAFIWEVLCQGKVIRERPLPGIAHAFVFWGFLAFALVSLNHLAAGLRLAFLPPESLIGRFYFLFAAAWALLVAISIAALFIRRFLLRPIWLGEKLSYESGLIALLIFTLMATYLATFLTPGGTGSHDDTTLKALWWTHTLALLIFLPLIPHTKHLHLVLSPITIFLKRDGFSAIPPLSTDENVEDFGLSTGKDLTQLIALQAYSCVECGRCTEHCPASTTGKVLNPKEIILGTRTYLNEFGNHSDAPLLTDLRSTDLPLTTDHLSLEAAFECTTCGACEYQCPVGIQHLPIIVGLRRGATNTGAWEDPYGTKLFLALEKSGNSLGLPSAERDKFIARQSLPIFDGTQEYCLWLGCMGAYDPHGREIIADFARIMDHLGTTFGVLKKEKCTGDPARRLGNDLIFQTLAESGLESFRTQRVQKIIAICPHCVRTIATDWREFGIAPEIEHHSEFMARHKSRLPSPQNAVILNEVKNPCISSSSEPPPNSTETIVYHDPCYLGRYRNIYDEPRSVIAAAGELVEPERTRERSFCCGAGGGLAFLGEESGQRVSHVRAQELVATGATTIGAACPFCNTMFRDALSANGENSPRLLDIAQIAAAQLPKTPPS
jgi:Fe-S oxidoreductase